MVGNTRGAVPTSTLVECEAHQGGQDVLVIAMTATGQASWSRCYGDGGDQSAMAVAVVAGGDIALAGEFEGTLDFGGGASVTSTGGQRDAFIARLDAQGEGIWAKAITGAGVRRFWDVTEDDNGDLWAVGYTYGAYYGDPWGPAYYYPGGPVYVGPPPVTTRPPPDGRPPQASQLPSRPMPPSRPAPRAGGGRRR